MTIVAVLIVAVPLAYVRVVWIDHRAEDALDDRAMAMAVAVHHQLGRGEPVGGAAVQSTLPPGSRATLHLPGGEVVEVGGSVEGPTRKGVSPEVEGVRVVLTANADDTVAEMREAVLVVVGLTVATLLAAAYAGRVLARRLSRPIEQLAAAAAAAGQGDLAVRMPRSGVQELDEVAAAIDTTVQRLEVRLQHERQLSDQVAHQLRNSLTALRLQTEVAELTAANDQQRSVISAIVGQIERLDETIRDLTQVARRVPLGPVAPSGRLVAEAAEFWRPSFERLDRSLEVDSTTDAGVEVAPSRQGIDVVLENALRHGAGTVRVSTAERDGHVVVTVEDEGPGIPEGMERAVFEQGVSHGAAAGGGQGLALARDLLEVRGGRLELSRRQPPRFELWLPTQSPSEGSTTKGEGR